MTTAFERHALPLFLFLFLTPIINASIHDYSNEPFTHRSDAFFFHGGSEALFAKSFIRFETVTFARPRESASVHGRMQSNTGLVEAIILEVRDRNRIGGSYLKSDLICCDPKLAKDRNCNLGEVIIQKNPDNHELPKRIKTFFQGTDEQVQMDAVTLEINATGMYYLYFMFCDPSLKGTTIQGRTVWRNPNGYLPGKMAPLMTLYGFMSLAYLLLGLAWFLRFVQFWKDIIQLHYHITAVIALGMCEMAVWYFEYANFNSTGTRPMGITLWAVTFTSVKKTLSRLLLLVVSMGYGVVRPTLGGNVIAYRVLLLGLLYFSASEALELVEHLGNINDFSGKTKLLLVLPVVCLDSCFILWIFSSLSKTLEKLQAIFTLSVPSVLLLLIGLWWRNLAKLELYRKFTNTLAVCCCPLRGLALSVLTVFNQLYFNATDPLSELWQIAWIIPAFWCLLSYALLVVICILWAPSRNPTRYAYMEETGDDFDEEGISLTSSVAKISGDVAAKLDRKAIDHAFGEDLEEDKRE
ncbi:hypothetical protein JHK82_018121 [Glycine max]|nr:hypothetical protein JHK82_018121 [Glycine max]